MPEKLVGRGLFFGSFFVYNLCIYVLCILMFFVVCRSKTKLPMLSSTPIVFSTPVLNLKRQPRTCQHQQEMCQGQIGAADRDTLWHCLSHTTSNELLAARAKAWWQSSTWWPGGRYKRRQCNWETERGKTAPIYVLCCRNRETTSHLWHYNFNKVQWMFMQHSLSWERQQRAQFRVDIKSRE